MTESRPVYHARQGNKYHARKVTADGYTFDSMAEYRRYCELKALASDGQITSLTVHPVFELQPAFKRGKERIRAVTYEGDFEYFEGDKQIVEDVKGVETAAFKLKKKLLLFAYPDIEFRIVEA